MSLEILVVGATGSIGRPIVEALAAHRDAVVVVGARDPRQAAQQLADLPAVRIVELDLERPETARRAMTGVAKLALVSPLSPRMGQQTRALLDAARSAGVRHVVRSSLLGVDEPDPIDEAVWHAEADAAVRESGIAYTILRPNQYFQNFIKFGNAATVRDQGALYLPLADSRVSNIDTRDIGAAAATVLLTPGHEHAGRTYLLTGGASYTMDEVAAAIGQALGKPVRYVAVDTAQYRQGMIGAAIPEVIVDAILGWFAYCRAGRADRIETGVERLLGRRPLSLDQFARDHVSRYR